MVEEAQVGGTTEDLVGEYPEGEEAELLPAIEQEREDKFPIQPYEGATPVPIGDEIE